MLKCRKTFIQGGYTIAAGETFEGLASVEDWMLSSFPAHFERAVAVANAPTELADRADADEPVEVVVSVEVKDVEAPAVDKMLKRPAKRK